mgnify:CR=1 FL=1
MNKGLFLDRDGVVNFDYKYVCKIENFKFRPEIFNICKIGIHLDFKIIVITNQSGIGQELFSDKDFHVLNNHMLDIFKIQGIKITDVYYCPYHPSKGKGIFLNDSFDRKPKPGMILKASKKHQINLNKSLMVGDSNSDYQASINSNIKYYVDAKKESWDTYCISLMKKISKSR